jgi:hypothetical protein
MSEIFNKWAILGKWDNIHTALVWNQSFNEKLFNLSAKNVSFFYFFIYFFSSGSAEPCNGRGECKCGFCECFSRGSNMTECYFGRYCECDDFSCPKHEGKLCGGNNCFSKFVHLLLNMNIKGNSPIIKYLFWLPFFKIKYG